MIGKTFSHYKILEKIGEGGMGVVYRAEDIKLKREVALKFLSPRALGTPEERARLVLEGQAAAALNHPNICTIHEIDEADSRMFIAMEHVDGQSLKARIESDPLPLKEVLSIAIQVAEGLAEAHQKGIIHRDIKPANIMLSSKGQAKISDFGLAKSSGQTKLTKTGTTVGTVAYMSPEQARAADVDHRCDIWSLGATLYEMSTGLRPFLGDDDQAVIYSILNEEPEPMTGLRFGIPVNLERIVAKTLAKRREERYQGIPDLLVDLRALAKDVSEGNVTAPTRASRVGVAPYAHVVAIPTFENRTADGALDAVGRRAADLIAEGLAEVATSEIAFTAVRLRSPGSGDATSNLRRNTTGVREMAEGCGAASVVSGAYYAEDGCLRFQIEITKTDRAGAAYALPAIFGSQNSPESAMEEVSQRVLGALVADFDPAVDSHAPALRTYREYMAGMELWSYRRRAALEHFKTAMGLDRTYVWPRVSAAVIHETLGDHAEASSVLNGVRQARGKLAVLERAGLDWALSWLRHDFGSSLRSLHRADRILETRAPTRYMHRLSIKGYIGLTALTLNRPREALDALESLFELWEQCEPHMLASASTWERWGFQYSAVAHHKLGCYEEELATARRARGRYPDDPRVRWWEARALAAMGRTEEVIEALDDSLELYSESGPQGWTFGFAVNELRAHGYREASVALANRGLEWHSCRSAAEARDEEHRSTVAELLYATGRWDEAQVLIEGLAAEHPENIYYIGWLGAHAARTGDSEEALSISAQLEEREQQDAFGSSAYCRAWIAAQLGELEHAVQLLRDAFAQGCGHPWSFMAHTDVDLEPLKNYPPFQRLMQPKG